MGRGNGDTTMASSSIALLQERFRKLERIKEKRQERELLKLFSESQRIVSPSPILTEKFEAERFTYPEPMILPNRPQPLSQDCLLSLGPNHSSKGKHLDFVPMKNETSNLWPDTTAGSSSSIAGRKLENSEIDTSLHL